MAIISTVTLAFIAFVPTINETIPNTPKAKMIDYLIYLQVLTTILTMIDSLITFRNEPTAFVFEWSTNGWFIATFIINAAAALVIVIMFIIHKVYW